MTRVLVIDDDKSVCLAIEMFLRHHECLVVLANGGNAGIEAFEASDFDVVLVDIFMPGMDGLETIKRFRTRAPSVPIIAMSGFRFRGPFTHIPDFLGMATKLGATCCLRKPFGTPQLMSAINACLGDRFTPRPYGQAERHNSTTNM